MAKIPTPRFNLKSPETIGESLIFLIFRYRGKKVLYSTSLTIVPGEWDFNKQRPIEKERRPDLWSIRRKLDDLTAHCKSIYIDYNYGAISVAHFKEKLDQLIGKNATEIVERKIPFLQFLDLELEELKSTNENTGTYRMFKLHVNIIKRYAKEVRRFDYEDVDWDFRLKFIDWLSDKNVQLNYGNKTLNVLRQFLERARRKKLHNNTAYQGVGWSVPQLKAKGPKIFLSVSELIKLWELELYGRLEKARDLFLIGAATGQRFSDYSRFQPEHFYNTLEGIQILSIISQKTATPSKVPINIFPWLIPTLEKYAYYSPTLSRQKFNDYIKELCKIAGITQKTLVIEQFIGRRPKIKKSYAPKYELVSSHACRRSFATNLYTQGFRLSQIMPMTGHATESQLREYIGLDTEENAVKIARSVDQQNNSISKY